MKYAVPIVYEGYHGRDAAYKAVADSLKPRHQKASGGVFVGEPVSIADQEAYDSGDVARALIREHAERRGLAAAPAQSSRAAVTVAASARCPNCEAEDQLRIEYRYDLLGLDRDGQLVVDGGGELTDILCLACGEEVDDVIGPEGSGPADGS